MYIEPMLLESADKPFDDGRYIAEWKQDGWRMLLIKWDGRLKLFSRHRNEFTSVFKEFQDLDIPDYTILDCELISVGPEGKCDFETLQKEYRSKNRTLKLALVDLISCFIKPGS
ncbi:ATP-dependent DNA ligase [Peribacillus tepidiphilus]|jgi:DNA ligase-1|uniref:ATP-dependent DNA ligase n=1 Tax=Peribacillus tepidiphilus TaxID=2652445 RepID=UPI0035B56405